MAARRIQDPRPVGFRGSHMAPTLFDEPSTLISVSKNSSVIQRASAEIVSSLH
jgi:hypothetical protein